jgi:hypothetical protein
LGGDPWRSGLRDLQFNILSRWGTLEIRGISSYTSTLPKYIVQRSPFRERKKWSDKTGDILKYENVTWLLNRGQLMDNHDNKFLNPFKCSAIVYSRSVIFTEFHHQKFHIFLLIFDIWLIFHLRLKYKWIAVEHKLVRRVGRYQGVNQNPYIEEEQTTQWPKEKVQKNKQWSTKHTYKTKDRLTRTLLKTGGELRCSGRVSRSCSTSDTRRINLVTKPVISHIF